MLPVGNWKEVYGCCGYFISDQGQLYSVRSNKLLKPSTSDYMNYRLVPNGCKKSRPFSASRLVLSHFGKTSKLRPFVDHIDNDCQNNSISNLRAVNRTINQLNRSTKGYRKYNTGTTQSYYIVNRYYITEDGCKVKDYISFPDQKSADIGAEELKQRFIQNCFKALEEREQREGVSFRIDPTWYLLFKKKVKGRGIRGRFS